MNVFRYIHRWENEKSNLIFYTFPMIHVGTKEYYDQISNMCDDFNMILVEGVQLGRKPELGTYKKTAKIFGLKNQNEFLNSTRRFQ
jgi:hypothetical protein